MLSTGRMKQITIQRQSQTQDSTGAPVEGWTDVCTVMAQMIPLQGKEYWQAKQTQSKASLRLVLHYLPGLTDGLDSSMRVVLADGSIYQIESPPINPGGLNKEIQLYCAEYSEEQ